jgi:hypothetical protein
MSLTVSLSDANVYFTVEVLHSKPWDKADDTTKQKALNNAERVLYRFYRELYDLTDETKKMPATAIYEQALWMLRQDESIQQEDFGVTGLGVGSINIQMKGNPASLIAPEAERIIEEDQENNDDDGNGYNGRFGWLVM